MTRLPLILLLMLLALAIYATPAGAPAVAPQTQRLATADEPCACTCPVSDLIIRCVMGETNTPTPCHVELLYLDGGPLNQSLTLRYDEEAETGIIAHAVLPGAWTVLVRDSPALWCDNPPAVIWVLPGEQYVLTLRFYARPTPGPTLTPTATATPETVACPNYAQNCKIACGANEQADVYKRCGVGFVCCLPMATRTAVP